MYVCRIWSEYTLEIGFFCSQLNTYLGARTELKEDMHEYITGPYSRPEGYLHNILLNINGY